MDTSFPVHRTIIIVRFENLIKYLIFKSETRKQSNLESKKEVTGRIKNSSKIPPMIFKEMSW
jgi:hypothetical protein